LQLDLLLCRKGKTEVVGKDRRVKTERRGQTGKVRPYRAVRRAWVVGYNELTFL
jgi:hypothetical protein